MTKDEYLALYRKSLRGNCSDQELEQLENYTDDFELIESSEINASQHQRIYTNLQKAIKGREKVKLLGYWSRAISAAAVLTFVLLGVIYLIYVKDKRTAAPAYAVTKKSAVIQPGTNKATLLLSNGRTIELNSAAPGQIALENGTEVIKKEGDILSYSEGSTVSEKVAYNTISVPRGGQYSLVLPDGTKVFLNALSTLRFPTKFTGDTREIDFSGEGYFEVAKNQNMPFYVNTQDMKVKVLGTHFNLMAYKDEAFVKTTLLEGKVMLSSAEANAYLIPGQQGVFASGKFKVGAADIEQDLAWKNGYFIFNGENLNSIMRKISRWYDVDITYANHNPNLSYTGAVSRFKNITEVLKVLSLTGTVKFSVEERRITVIN
ncbi:FecR family protein [Pedobacter sp. PWIIR3]